MPHPADSPVVIFGDQRSAQLARFLLQHDSPHEVVAFCVDGAYRKAESFDGLPLVDFETLAASYPPGRVRLLIPIGYHRINGLRRARYEAAKAQGYSFVTYVSSRASVWPGLEIGENSVVHELAVIQPFASLGDNVIVRSAAHVSHHCRVASHAFIAAQVAMAGDTTVGEQAFVGVGAVLRDQINIAPRSFIGAGAVVTSDTEEGCAYFGNPARRVSRHAERLL
jgi:sugar O-acyltransferase (sialic acid O-acetyltransferase NeuD family)